MTESPIRYSQKTALIVEDFSQYAYSLRGMMMTIGSRQVDLAYTGEGAIQACKEFKYDIILCDYNLGDSKDGQQILEELHRFNLMKKTAVFIIVTAENDREMVMGALEQQPDSYITKPFNALTLQNRLDKAIIKKQVLLPISALILRKDLAAAVKKCDDIIQTHPKFKMTCLRQKYYCLKRLKRYDEALKLTTIIINERPIPWAMLGIGEILYYQGKMKVAEAFLRDMVHEFPLVPEGYDWLAKVQYQLGQKVKAQETLSKAIEISPKVLDRQRRLGAISEENFDFDTMTDAYRQAVKLGKHSIFARPDEYIKLAKSISMLLQSGNEVDRDKLINEAQSAFIQLNQSFDTDAKARFRSAVAQADFSSQTNNKAKMLKCLKSADKFYDRLEEMLSANESLEVSGSLKKLGRQDFVEMILEEAVEQYFDDPEFMQSVQKLTTNKHLLINAKRANLYNKKASLLFKAKKYDEAIENFTKAGEIAPNNVDINLNHAQALLKCFVADKKSTFYLQNAEAILDNVPALSATDPRNQRYMELRRLSQVIQQNL